jgi:hypothetical protein
LLGCVGLALLGASGCDLLSPAARARARAERLLKEAVALLNEMADAQEKGDQARVAEIQSKLEEVGKQLDDLKLTEAEKKRLEEKYRPEMERAMARFMAAALKAGPGL